ncbi:MULTISPECIES: hypothetical protein [unclassified Halomonas]|uniref:hypothetical protein n=1 Tax=unclassified Halomonas TaxID=2609666 RepID=UPI000482F0DC|nr:MULTISPECIES: hypothetical protein [unclassified Halomonas]
MLSEFVVNLMSLYKKNNKRKLMVEFKNEIEKLDGDITVSDFNALYEEAELIPETFYKYLIIFLLFSNRNNEEIEGLIYKDKHFYTQQGLQDLRKCFLALSVYLNSLSKSKNKFFLNFKKNIDKALSLINCRAVEYLERSISTPLYSSFNKKKVFFIVGYVPISEKGAHLRLLLNVAGNFAKYNSDVDVEIIFTGENSINKHEFKGVFGLYSQLIDDNYYSRLKNVILTSSFAYLLNQNLQITVFQNSRLECCYAYLHSFGNNPFLFFWSGHTSSFFLSLLSVSKFKTGILFFNNKDSYLSIFDIIIKRNMTNKLKSENEFFLPFPPSEFPSINYDSGVGEEINSSPILTVLAGKRLPKIVSTYSKKMLDDYFEFLYSKKEYSHLIIGFDNEDLLTSIDERFRQAFYDHKLKLLNKTQFLHAYYKKAKIMLHLPEVVGGGGGVSMARDCALPVLCFDYSDPSPHQHPDYLFKRGEESLFYYTAKKILDENLSEKIGLQQKNYQNNFSKENFSIRLRELMHKIGWDL